MEPSDAVGGRKGPESDKSAGEDVKVIGWALTWQSTERPLWPPERRLARSTCLRDNLVDNLLLGRTVSLSMFSFLHSTLVNVSESNIVDMPWPELTASSQWPTWELCPCGRVCLIPGSGNEHIAAGHAESRSSSGSKNWSFAGKRRRRSSFLVYFSSSLSLKKAVLLLEYLMWVYAVLLISLGVPKW
jgi:hypothetical protein